MKVYTYASLLLLISAATLHQPTHTFFSDNFFDSFFEEVDLLNQKLFEKIDSLNEKMSERISTARQDFFAHKHSNMSNSKIDIAETQADNQINLTFTGVIIEQTQPNAQLNIDSRNGTYQLTITVKNGTIRTFIDRRNYLYAEFSQESHTKQEENKDKEEVPYEHHSSFSQVVSQAQAISQRPRPKEPVIMYDKESNKLTVSIPTENTNTITTVRIATAQPEDAPEQDS